MRVPLAEVGRRGRMDITFASQDCKTVLRHAYCEVPFKITRVLNSGAPRAHVMLMHCTAGLFGGDELECVIRVERDARVLITQQSASKIHPAEDRAAVQRSKIVVESGAELQIYLEPVIPFAGSILQQSTQIDVDPGGRLIFWEGFMAGRVGRGERWHFRKLMSETRLRYSGRLVYLDRFVSPNGLERSERVMGDCSYLGTGLSVGQDARRVVSALHEAMPGAGVDALTDEVALTRLVSGSGPEFHRCRAAFQECSQTFVPTHG